MAARKSPRRHDKAATSGRRGSNSHRGQLSKSSSDLGRLVSNLPSLDRNQLLLQCRNHVDGIPPAHLPTWLLARLLAYRLQAATLGDLKPALLRRLRSADAEGQGIPAFANRSPATREGDDLKPRSILAREWRGRLERVTVMKDGFAWNGMTYRSLSMVAKAITGTSWNGHRFFGLKSGRLKPAGRSNDLGNPQGGEP